MPAEWKRRDSIRLTLCSWGQNLETPRGAWNRGDNGGPRGSQRHCPMETRHAEPALEKSAATGWPRRHRIGMVPRLREADVSPGSCKLWTPCTSGFQELPEFAGSYAEQLGNLRGHWDHLKGQRGSRGACQWGYTCRGVGMSVSVAMSVGSAVGKAGASTEAAPAWLTCPTHTRQ